MHEHIESINQKNGSHNSINNQESKSNGKQSDFKVSTGFGSSNGSVTVFHNGGKSSNKGNSANQDPSSQKSYSLMKSQNELHEKNIKNLNSQIKKLNKELQELYTEKS